MIIMEYPETGHGVVSKHPGKKIVIADIQHDGIALLIEFARGKFVPPRHRASGRAGRTAITGVALAPDDPHDVTAFAQDLRRCRAHTANGGAPAERRDLGNSHDLARCTAEEFGRQKRILTDSTAAKFDG